MANGILYSKDPPPPRRHDKTQVLGTYTERKNLTSERISPSQTEWAINYRSVWSPKQSSYLVLGTKWYQDITPTL